MPEPRRILVLGAGGMVSTAFVRLLGERAFPVSERDCDIRDYAAVARLIEAAAPAAIFNCAAITDVDRCEREPAVAAAVNRDAVAHLARVCRERDIPLVHYSTDYVFDGSGEAPWRETDARNPINVYGRTKAESETAIETSGAEHLILRIQWVYGDGRPNFVTDTASRLRAGDEVRAFCDQSGTPCSATEIARMTLDLFERGHRGLFHLANTGYATRVQVAEEIARALGIASPRITPVRTRDVRLAAARPLNSRMCTDKLEGAGVRPLTWQDDVGSWLRSHQAPFQGSGDASPCPTCGVARGRLSEVTAERDRLLRAVAVAEERANALLLGYPVPPDRQSPGALPSDAAVDRTPLRHRLVDLLNSEIKRTLGPAHRGAKRLAEAALRWSNSRKRRREP